jgi:streptogramin lyase
MFNMTSCYRIGVLALVAWAGTLNPASAEGPWKWQYSLNLLKGKMGNQVVMPTALYVDEEKRRYYVVDAGGNSLHSFDLEGQYLNTFKPGEQLRQPYTMQRGVGEILWLVEKGRNTLTMVDFKNKSIVNKPLKIADRDVFPDRVVFSGGEAYVSDKLTGRLVVFDEEMRALREIVCRECRGGIKDFEIQADGIWVLDGLGKFIYRLSNTGEVRQKIDIGNEVSFPFAFALDLAGQFYVLDRHNGSIAVLDETGALKFRIMSKGHGHGNLYYPEDLLFDYWGRLCVVDSGNGRVEIYQR